MTTTKTFTEADIAVLRKKLQLTKPYITCYGHEHGRDVRHLFLQGHLKVTEVIHSSKWAVDAETDLANAKSITTYDECIRAVFHDDETVELLVSDKISSYHTPVVRCRFILEGEWWLIAPFVAGIERAWINRTQSIVDAETRATQELRRLVIAEQLLQGTYQNSDILDEAE